MTRIDSFEDLDCWKVCKELRILIMNMTKKFPKEEKYDLTSNIKRAVRSSTRNISEGFGRHHLQENIQFCRISRGSLYEVNDDLLTALEEEYIDEKEYNDAFTLVARAKKVLNGYIRYLEKAKGRK